MSLTERYTEVSKCGRCGFCQFVCPIYYARRDESAVARGRLTLLRDVLEGKTSLDGQMSSVISDCLLCGACTEECFPAIPTDEIIVTARAEYLKRYGQPQLQRFAFHELLPYPNRLHRLLKLAAAGRRMGVSGLLRVVRLLGWYGKQLYNADTILSEIPRKFLCEEIPTLNLKPAKPRGKLVYFTSCGTNYGLPRVGLATLQLLVQQGFEVTTPANFCCGLPPYAYGDLEAARNLARKNLEVFRNTNGEKLVTDCASCSSFLKKYPELFADEPELAERGRQLAHKVVDISQFAAGLEWNLPHDGGTTTVTYHDPCHLRRKQKIVNEPRSLLKRLPWVEFRELPEAGWCCGGAGSYNIMHYELSLKVLERKLDNVERTGAKILATSCPACMIQLSHGVRKRGLAVEVRHVIEMLAL